MTYIAGLVIVGLFILTLKYFLDLTKRQEITISILLLSIVLGAIAYNTYNSNQREKMLDVVTRYKQGKSILCDNKEISAKNYTLSIGTYTFIGKKDTPNYAEMIPATSCK